MEMNKKIKGIVLIVAIILVLMIPIFMILNNNSKIKKYDDLTIKINEAARKYVIQQNLNLEVSSVKVKLGELKKNSLVSISLKNPKTNKHFSNESYVIVSKENDKYKYDVKLYDIPDKETSAKLIITMNGNKKLQNGISAKYDELGVVFTEGSNELTYSTQYFLKDEEVLTIDSSKPKNYEVVYTALNKEGELAKTVRTVIVQ